MPQSEDRFDVQLFCNTLGFSIGWKSIAALGFVGLGVAAIIFATRWHGG